MLILIADDEQDVRTIVSKSLRARGFDVVEAADGLEGWEAVRRAKPDVVISDVNMPVMDGFAFLAKIRDDEETAGLPVIMLTCRAADRDVLAGYAHGADYYVTKPFRIEQILEGIELLTTPDKDQPRKYRVL